MDICKLTKSDLVYLLIQRKDHTKTKQGFYTMNKKNLIKKIGLLSGEEILMINKRKKEREMYTGDIEYNCLYYNICKNYSKNSKIDCLINYEIKFPIKLNEEQNFFLNKCISNSDKTCFVGLSGPGGGKTQTLISIVSELYKMKYNVLVLMYNINTEKQFCSKTKAEKVKITNKKFICHSSGIYIVTFHKYAYYSRFKPNLIKIDQNIDYDSLIDISCNIPSLNSEKWDFVIVDEAQDITYSYKKLIDSIKYNKIIYMGDPRQQIKTEAYAFSEIIHENKENINKLFINHRSNSEIIDFLNRFSKNNFDEYEDIQQTIFSLIQGKVVIVKGKEASLVSKYALEYPEGENFIITPVSVRKYNMDKTTDKIRQILYENGRKVIVSESERLLNPNNDYISTSSLIKGLERNQVILYGISNTQMYIDYSIQSKTLKCLIYVALSRAIKRLVVVIDEKKYKVPNLLDKCIFDKIDLENNFYVSPNFSGLKINVTDLSEYYFPFDIEEKKILPKITFDREYVEDCAGLYIESCIAKKLGCLKRLHQINIKNNNNNSVSYLMDDTYQYFFNKKNNKKELVKSIFDDIKHSNDEDEYKYVRAHYVNKIGHDWKVSEKLKNIKINIEDYISEIKKNINPIIIHQKKIEYNIKIDRSFKSGGIIIGVPDLSNDYINYEIKHAIEKNKHMNQTCIYQIISNKDSYLLNTYEGYISKINIKMSINKFNHYVRAILMLREAHRLRKGIKMNLPRSIVIVIDTEFYNNKYNEICVCEIGCVILDISKSVILDVYQKNVNTIDYDDGKNENDSFFNLTGLKVINRYIRKINPRKAFPYFYKMIDKYYDAPIIQWGSVIKGDSYLLNLNNRKTIDLSEYFKIFKSMNENKFFKSQYDYRLKDAVDLLFPPRFEWEPHRAFEDALMTAGVYYILSKEI